MRRKASMVRGAIHASTGPPMRSVVWRDMGSSKRISASPAAARSITSRAALSTLSRFQDLFAHHPHVTRAQRDEDVTVAQQGCELARDLGALAHVDRALVTARAHLVDQARRM